MFQRLKKSVIHRTQAIQSNMIYIWKLCPKTIMLLRLTSSPLLRFLLKMDISVYFSTISNEFEKKPANTIDVNWLWHRVQQRLSCIIQVRPHSVSLVHYSTSFSSWPLKNFKTFQFQHTISSASDGEKWHDWFAERNNILRLIDIYFYDLSCIFPDNALSG